MSELNSLFSDDLPSKFKNIATLAEHHPVPPMRLITEEHLSEWLTNFEVVRQMLEEIERNIVITSGAFLNKDMEKIHAALALLKWSEQGRLLLVDFVSELVTVDGTLDVAVRSACKAEDLKQKSFAGIYESVLNVNADDLEIAILTVLNSYYSLRAIMEKLHAGGDEVSSTVNIIVQKMVNPEFSGVAFSCDPLSGQDLLFVEYIPGLGEGLVSGESEPKLLVSSEEPQHRDALQQISRITRSARALLGGHVDIEWAYEQGIVWLLQARLVTANIHIDCDSKPYLNTWPLYDELPEQLLEKLPSWALYFHQKRKPLSDIARRYQKVQPGALILQANSYAINNLSLCQEWLASFKGKQVVVDFSDAVRQLIIDKSELLAQIAALMIEPGRIYTIVIRDFIKGEYGLITRQIQTTESSHLVAEISADGLLAMNRGSAISKIIALDDSQQIECLSQQDIQLLRQVTEESLKTLSNVQIEWVLENNQLYAIDYSPVNDSHSMFSHDGRVMSQGYAHGQIYIIAETKEIENYSIAPSMSLTDVPDFSAYGDLFSNIVTEIAQLSSPPIILARRPYAALASLIPLVSGFVFEKGSLLCHLGVLLREKKLPAICDENLFNQLQHGDTYLLDTHLTN